MNSKKMYPQEIIVDKILYLRNQKVMLDSDLALLYGTTTKRLNEQVKRNLNRFPKNFMFQLTKEEKDEVVANCDHLKNLKYSSRNPYAFTEHGALMLANVLRSDKAIEASIQIVETFKIMREILSTDLKLKTEIENIHKKLNSHDKNIELVFSYLEELVSKKETPRKKIGYTNCISK
jgi:phage regulator Rha-like protein